jgi:hypothetical protein
MCGLKYNCISIKLVLYILYIIVCDRNKKAEITLVQEDFDEIKHEHKINHTPSTLFTIGLSMSQIVLRSKTREKIPVRTFNHIMLNH